MNIDECFEYYEESGYGEFKTYDENGLTIRLVLKFNHPWYPIECYTREVVGGSPETIASYDGGDNWQID